jgi:hypothetical protein
MDKLMIAHQHKFGRRTTRHQTIAANIFALRLVYLG